MQKIKKVIPIYGISHEVGENGVTEILDRTLQYPDSLHNIIWIMKNNICFVKIVNVPMIIEHFEGV